MSQPYSIYHTLKGYDKPICCLAFSPTGEFLATGGEDECLRVWNSHDAKLLACISVNSPILCLEWDPLHRKRLFFGCQSGTVAFIDNFGKAPAQQIQTGIEGGQVYAMSIDGYASRVGISIGPEVHIARELVADGSYATFSILPAPNLLPETAKNSDIRVRARSLKFIKNGTRILVSYLNHGVVCWDIQSSLPLWRIIPAHENRHIGSSMLSPDGRSLLVSNLSNGMSLYSLETLGVSSSYRYTVNAGMNFPLSVAFLKRGKLVTCGTHTGAVEIRDKKTGEIFQTLDHDAPLITCLSVHTSNGYEYIATATTENEPQIKIWRADARSTFLETLTEYWQHSTIWLNDNYSEKRSRDIVLVICVALGTYLFMLYIQEPVVSPNDIDTRFTTWTNSVEQFLTFWTTSILSAIYRMWVDTCRVTRQGLVNWLEIQPHEVRVVLDVDNVELAIDLPPTIYL